MPSNPESSSKQSAPEATSKFDRVVVKVRWYLLTIAIAIISLWYGGLLQRKLDQNEKLSFLDQLGVEVLEAPENAGKIFKNPDVLKDPRLEPEYPLSEVQQISEHQIYRIGEDKIPIDKSLLYSGFDHDRNLVTVTLRNLKTNEVERSWEFDAQTIETIWQQFSKEGCPHFLDSTVKVRANLGFRTPLLLKNGNLVADLYCQICCFDDDCNLIWSIDRLSHHSLELDHEGNLWTCGRKTEANLGWDEETLMKIDAETGEILYNKPLTEVFMDNPAYDLSHHNRENSDLYHLNDIQPVMSDSEHWQQGDVFLSVRNLNTVLLYRPSTGKILWIDSVNWSMQHDIEIYDHESITIFDNNVILQANSTNSFYPRKGLYNRLLLYNFRTREVQELFQGLVASVRCLSATQGRFKLFPEDQLGYAELNTQGFFLIIDITNDTAYKCVIPGNSESTVGRLGWFRLVD